MYPLVHLLNLLYSFDLHSTDQNYIVLYLISQNEEKKSNTVPLVKKKKEKSNHISVFFIYCINL